MELVAIGKSAFLPGFALAGVHTILASKDSLMGEIRKRKDALVIVDGQLAAETSEEDRELIATSVDPLVITLSQDSNLEIEQLRRMIRSTLGVDLLK